MLAARGGHSETVKALIEAGADITLRKKVSLWNKITLCCSISCISTRRLPLCWPLKVDILRLSRS